MAKFSITNILIKLLCLLLPLSVPLSASTTSFEDPSFSVGLEQSYRQDHSSFNIAGFNNYPNVLSELTWSNLHVWETTLKGQVDYPNRIFLRGNISYGVIFDGKNRDSDWFLNNRRGEFSRSYADVDGDYTLDLSLKSGYHIPTSNEHINLSPYLGLTYKTQKMRDTNGKQTIATDLDGKSLSDMLGEIQGLNSTYKNVWWGPLAGVDIGYTINKAWHLFAGIEAYLLQYEGHGDWNLRRDLPDGFKNKSKHSWGYRNTLGARFTIANHWCVSVEYGHEKLVAKKGTKYTPTSKKTYKQPLNHAENRSDRYTLSVDYSF